MFPMWFPYGTTGGITLELLFYKLMASLIGGL